MGLALWKNELLVDFSALYTAKISCQPLPDSFFFSFVSDCKILTHSIPGMISSNQSYKLFCTIMLGTVTTDHVMSTMVTFSTKFLTLF